MILRFMIELDMLLDTRIAAVSQLSQKAAIDLLSDKYRNRLSDDMGEITEHVTTDEFKRQYAKRNVDTLKVSRPTPMMFLFSTMINNNLEMSKTTDQIQGIEIDVNTYPYNLDDLELAEIVNCVLAYINYPVVVRTIFKAPYELPFEEIKVRQWSGIYLYNFRDWAECVVPKIDEKTPTMPSAFMVVPELLKSQKELPTNEDMTMANGERVTPFQAIRMALAPYISVRYVTPEYVSIAELPPMDVSEEKTDANAVSSAQPPPAQESSQSASPSTDWEEL